MPNPWARREIWFLTLAILLGAIGAAWFYVSRATTLTIAVAPLGGTEPALLRSYADELAARKSSLRLKIVSFEGVRESAEALQAGQADLAVVRPDVMMPRNGMTLAVLREQAIFVATPATSGIKTFPDLAAKRLGILARRIADGALVQAVLDHNGLRTSTGEGRAAPGVVTLVPLEEDDLSKAFSDGLVDAVVLVTTPTTPAALRLVRTVQDVAENREVVLFGLPEVAAIVARLPKLQPVTIPSGLFGGQPRLPEDDLSTVGPSYRLMARSSLSRSAAAEVTQHLFEMRAGLAEKVAAAEGISHPAYDTTVAATSARIPIHPGALDYYEREQESFIERYESWIYLVAIFGGGIGSVYAWLRQRLSRIRRHRIEVATESLLELRGEARRATDLDRLRAMAAEIDDLAASIARNALNRPTEPRTLTAATVAIDAARSTVRRAIDGRSTGVADASGRVCLDRGEECVGEFELDLTILTPCGGLPGMADAGSRGDLIPQMQVVRLKFGQRPQARQVEDRNVASSRRVVIPHDHVMQLAGERLRIGADALLAALDVSATLRRMLLRYVQTEVVQVRQTAVVNGSFTIEARLARWLLMCHDRIEGDDLQLKHAFLSMMLGVQRSGVTLAPQTLEGAGRI